MIAAAARAWCNCANWKQQEATVAFQRTVLTAGKEIDDAFTGYSAERQQLADLTSCEQSARQAYELALARYDGGAVDFVTVLDNQRAMLQAMFEKASSEGRLLVRFVAINRALGTGSMNDTEAHRGVPGEVALRTV